MSGRRRSVDPGWRSGRSPATRERLRNWESTPQRPTLQHRTRSRPTSSDTPDREVRLFAGISLVGRIRAVSPSSCTHRLQRGDLHAPLRFGGRSVGRCGRNSTARVVHPPSSAGSSAAATSSSTAGTSRSATTSWILGAAFAAVLRALGGAAASAPRRPGRRARRRAGRRGARRGAARATSARSPSPGQRASSCRACARPARRASRGPRRACSSAGQHAGVAAPDLGERTPRREPGGDRDPQQVEHVRQLGLDRRGAAAARAPAQRGPRGRRSRPPARRGRARSPSRPGGGVSSGSAASAASSGEAGLQGDDLRDRPVESGGGDAGRQPARGLACRGSRRAGRRGRASARRLRRAAAGGDQLREPRRGGERRRRRRGASRASPDTLRQAPDAEQRDDLEDQREGRQPGRDGIGEQAREQPGLGELGEQRGADRQHEHDPRREARLRRGGDRVAVLARRGLERGREVAQQRREVAARVALEQDAGDDRVPGRRAARGGAGARAPPPCARRAAAPARPRASS